MANEVYAAGEESMNRVLSALVERALHTAMSNSIVRVAECARDITNILELSQAAPEEYDRQKILDAGLSIVEALEDLALSASAEGFDKGEVEAVMGDLIAKINSYREALRAAYESREPDLGPERTKAHSGPDGEKTINCRNCDAEIRTEVCPNCGTISPPELWPQQPEEPTPLRRPHAGFEPPV